MVIVLVEKRWVGGVHVLGEKGQKTKLPLMGEVGWKGEEIWEDSSAEKS